MIEKLTREQRARHPEFVDKWKKIGFSTEPANRPLAEEGIEMAYSAVGLPKPKIVWCTSPFANVLTQTIILHGQKGWGKNVARDSAGDSPAAKIWGKVWQSFGTSIGAAMKNPLWPPWASVKTSIEASVRASIRATVKDSVWVKTGDAVWERWTSIGDAVWASVWASVGDSVWASVGAPVEISVRDQKMALVVKSTKDLLEPEIVIDDFDDVSISMRVTFQAQIGHSIKDLVRISFDVLPGLIPRGFYIGDSGHGQNDADLLAMYDYLKEVLPLKNQSKKLEGLCLQAQSAGWFLPYQNICWMAERPTTLHIKNNRPHCELGPAMVYSDGWGVWALNGIQMKPEYVTTPAHKLTPEIVLKEANVDQRRELIRKIGVLRLINYGKIIDTTRDYKLVDMSPIFIGINYAPHILMKNPSLDDTWHLEGVDPQCTTVQEALNWRAGSMKVNWSPALLS